MTIDTLHAVNSYNVAKSLGLSGDTEDGGTGGGGVDFASLLSDSLSSARNVIRKSESLSASALMKNANLSDVVTAVSEADTALQTMISIRDKVISAYQDILKMPI